MRQRRGRMASEGEGEQEQHLDALGEIAVHVGGEAPEAVVDAVRDAAGRSRQDGARIQPAAHIKSVAE